MATCGVVPHRPTCRPTSPTRSASVVGAASVACFEDLLRFVQASLARALRGGECGDLAPAEQMDLLRKAEVRTASLRKASDAGNAEVRELLASLYKGMAAVASRGEARDAAASRAEMERYIAKAREVDPDDEEARRLLPELLRKLDVSFPESRADAEEGGAAGGGGRGEKGAAANVRPPQISNWIDVTKYQESVPGWKTSFEELLQLAKLLNATLVEPCMKDGRLASCAKEGAPFSNNVPFSDIFDLSDEMESVPPLVASYQEYEKSLQGRSHKSYKVCADKHRALGSCKASDMLVNQVNRTELFEGLGSKTTMVVLQIENYYWGLSIHEMEEHFDIAVPFGQHRDSAYYSFVDEGRLSFHPKHVQAVGSLLREAGVNMDSFSTIQWQDSSGDGRDTIDYNHCMKAMYVNYVCMFCFCCFQDLVALSLITPREITI